MSVRAGRDTHTFRMLRRRLRDEHRPKCWLCGQLIDYDLDKEDASSFSVDHIHPVSQRPDLVEVYSNLEAAHLGCNRARGNRQPMPSLGAGAVYQQW
ncbi:HNH endonuclease [Ornithinimicrobium sp. Arc0846-15]|nr:HNH endonuclease [Ornithinimicrobium laminariae]